MSTDYFGMDNAFPKFVKETESKKGEVAWMIPSIIPSGPYKGEIGWKPDVFCDSQRIPRVDKLGKCHYPYPLYK